MRLESIATSHGVRSFALWIIGFVAFAPLFGVARADARCSPIEPPSGRTAASDQRPPMGQAEERSQRSILQSHLVETYATEASQSARRRLEQIERSGRDVTRRTDRIRDLESTVLRDALRELVRSGLDASGLDRAEQRALAIETLAGLEAREELAEACRVLGADRVDGGRLATDREACLALLSALSRSEEGQAFLVRLAVGRDDLLGERAREALPRALAPIAEATLINALRSDADSRVNRAAMVASAHVSASLIPALIQAQASEPRRTQGDEGWIAFGRTRWYIANAIPVVGNGSTSFLPVPGSVFEGSVLRIQESVVTVYRTEVHRVLVSGVEELTGRPAPPFGYDRQRWERWYEVEFPRLVAAHRAQLEERAIRGEMRTTEVRKDM